MINTFGEALREWRKQKKISLESFSKLIGVEIKTINAYETDKHGVSKKVFDRFPEDLQRIYLQYRIPGKKGQLSKIKKRDCLGCQKSFNSEGPGNRLCATCRTETETCYDTAHNVVKVQR
jgi:transcriptional regulator with XRE-family HTH domain